MLGCADLKLITATLPYLISVDRASTEGSVPALLFCLAALFLSGCDRPAPQNLLLVTFDTVRADHMGYAGGASGVTPMLDAMAKRGTWFSTAITSQPLTLPAHTSIMTGLYPTNHGVRNNGTYVVPQEITTLAEQFQEQGYATHGIVSAFVLDSQFGLDQGFDSYNDDLSTGPKQKMFMFRERRATDTAIQAVKWLEQERPKDRGFFLWVHFFDPHADYEPPPTIAARFPGDPYSGEIHYADYELGRIFKSLDQQKLLDDTLFVFTSDHGDGLGEHGEKTHGIFVYESTTRVPLIISGPGVKAGGRVDQVVRTVDIAPTILDLFGMAPETPLDGWNLRPLWEGDEDQRQAYMETFVPRFNFGWAELRAVRSETLKVIDAPNMEVYDMAVDPDELNNLYVDDDHLDFEATAQVHDLDVIIEADPLYHGGHQQASMSDEVMERLAGLGYVWGDETIDDGEERADPKDRISYYERFQAGQAHLRRDEIPQAIESISALLTDDPENVVAMGSLAGALADTGETERALEMYRKMIKLDPRRETAYLGAARLLKEKAEYEEAAALLESVMEMQPDNPASVVAMGDLLLAQDNYADGEIWYRKALVMDPNSMLSVSGLGNLLNRAGRIDEALELLNAGHKKDPTSQSVLYNLAVVTEKKGDRIAAEALYRQSIHLDDGHAMSWNNLGSLLNKMGQKEKAIKAIAQAWTLDGTNVEATFNLAVLLFQSGRHEKSIPLFESALSMRPTLFQAAMFRARAFEATGRIPEARRAWQNMSKSAPPALRSLARLEVKSGNIDAARRAIQMARKTGDKRVIESIKNDPVLKPYH